MPTYGIRRIMFKLIVLRAAPLFLRPAAVLLEGALRADSYVLVIVLPIAALAVTISAVPVHIDFFRSHADHPDYQRQTESYVSALTSLILLSAVVLISTLAIMPSGLNAVLIASICFTFISEKLADEISRAFEFRKAFVKWFLVQCSRSVWLFLPIVAGLLGRDYAASFLLSAVLATIFMLWLFSVVTKLRPRLSWSSILLIRNNIIFLAGNFLPASYRQVPRITVTKFFPEQAHIFLAVAQICQGVALIYSVKFQIPYRKIIARRARMFQRRIRPATINMILGISVVFAGYLAMSLFGIGGDIVEMKLAAILVPLMMADSLMFGILSTHLGFLPWFVNRRDSLITYVLCLVGAGVIFAVLSIFGLLSGLTVLSIPMVTISIGMLWFALVIYRHFLPKQP